MDEIDCSRIALKHYMADRGAQSNLALGAQLSSPPGFDSRTSHQIPHT